MRNKLLIDKAKILHQERSPHTNIYIAWFPSEKVLEKTKLIFGKRNQDSSYF